MQLRTKLGPERNSICVCGSGKKYKKCCLKKQQEVERHEMSEKRRILEDDNRKKKIKEKDTKTEIIQESIKESSSTEGDNRETDREG